MLILQYHLGETAVLPRWYKKRNWVWLIFKLIYLLEEARCMDPVKGVCLFYRKNVALYVFGLLVTFNP
jgi:hypothetical protein